MEAGRDRSKCSKKDWANNPALHVVLYDKKLMKNEVFGQLS